MTTVLIISIAIVIGVLVFTILSISKGYQYKHTIDPIENNPHLTTDKPEEHKQ
ncbi:YtzI protein [Bacillus xiapuensis]|uniref:YtzI protein n=1 Tax=Bacillus xiapuensis TaxID=2014075 RepID=UPI000C2499E4|nr:YtzI protein [Bacillus xiapuensis]